MSPTAPDTRRTDGGGGTPKPHSALPYCLPGAGNTQRTQACAPVTEQVSGKAPEMTGAKPGPSEPLASSGSPGNRVLLSLHTHQGWGPSMLPQAPLGLCPGLVSHPPGTWVLLGQGAQAIPYPPPAGPGEAAHPGPQGALSRRGYSVPGSLQGLGQQATAHAHTGSPPTREGQSHQECRGRGEKEQGSPGTGGHGTGQALMVAGRPPAPC